MAWYVAQITKRDGACAVSFPDFPSMRISRASLEDAVECAAEALAWHVDALLAKGIALPAPTPVSDLQRATSPSGQSPRPTFAIIEIGDLKRTAHTVQATSVERSSGAAPPVSVAR